MLVNLFKKNLQQPCLEIIKNTQESKDLPKRLAWVQQVFDELPVSIIILDNEYKIVLTNKFHDDLTDHKNKDKIGFNILNSNGLRKRDGVIKKYQRLIQHGESFNVDDVFVKNSKNAYHLKIHAAPIIDESGEVYGAFSVGSDITELKKAEEELKNINQNLSNRVQQKTKELRQAIKFKDEFLADITHELRTPLAIIRGNLDLLTRYNKSFKSSEETEIIEEEINHMAALISNLTSLCNINLIHDCAKKKLVNIDDLVSTIKHEMTVIAKQKNIKINTLIQKNLNVWIDSVKIKKVLTNLISNAVKYGNENGYINLDFKAEDDALVITIEDNGIGIPEKDIPHIFNRLYRSEKSRSRDTGGSGIGLAIVKHNLDLHNGTIYVESKINKGSKFTISIPKTVDRK